jgi:hypothetical protein
MDLYSNTNFWRHIYYYDAFRRDFPVSQANARIVDPIQITTTASFKILLYSPVTTEKVKTVKLSLYLLSN